MNVLAHAVVCDTSKAQTVEKSLKFGSSRPYQSFFSKTLNHKLHPMGFLVHYMEASTANVWMLELEWNWDIYSISQK